MSQTPPPPSPFPDPRHALVAGLLCWAGFALVAALVLSGRSDAFDTAGLRFWRQGAAGGVEPAWLVEAVRDYTALGGPLLRNLLGMGALAALLLAGARVQAGLLFLTVSGGWIVEVALKAMVGRARPTIVAHLMATTGSSFPSGHSFNAAVVYIAMACAGATFSGRRAVRRTMIGASLLLTLLVGLSRVWLGVHYPTDALAGWLGGAGWAFLASAVLRAPAWRIMGSANQA